MEHLDSQTIVSNMIFLYRFSKILMILSFWVYIYINIFVYTLFEYINSIFTMIITKKYKISNKKIQKRMEHFDSQNITSNIIFFLFYQFSKNLMIFPFFVINKIIYMYTFFDIFIPFYFFLHDGAGRILRLHWDRPAPHTARL